MRQADRLRGHLDAHVRIVMIAPTFIAFIATLGAKDGVNCAIRMCFFRDAHFRTVKVPPS
jgi:hypothetical protein